MKKSTLFFGLLFIVANLFGQSKYEMVPIDSAKTKWVIRVSVTGQDGSTSIQQTPSGDSTKIADQFLAIIDGRKAQFETEIKTLSDGFGKSLGVTYDQAKKGKVKQEMAGNWNLVETGKDTMVLNINPGGTITGGTIRGNISVVDKDSIEMSGVLPGKIEFIRSEGLWISKDGKKKLIRAT